MNRENLLIALDAPNFGVRQFRAMGITSALLSSALPGAINQDESHRFGRRSEKMFATIPVLVRTGQPQPSFVNQSGRLKRLAGNFVGHLGGGQSAKFLINQWQEVLSGLGVALLNRVENECEVTHDD